VRPPAIPLFALIFKITHVNLNHNRYFVQICLSLITVNEVTHVRKVAGLFAIKTVPKHAITMCTWKFSGKLRENEFLPVQRQKASGQTVDETIEYRLNLRRSIRLPKIHIT
jgi:hypothetical protein